MNTIPTTNQSPVAFFLFVFAISVPFWVVGAFTEQLSAMLPINLPISALMFVCPITAALVFVYKENKADGMQALLKRAFDYKRIKPKIWYAPIILLMPMVMVLSYGIMRLLGRPLPEPFIPFGAIPIFFLVFFIGAIGEEIGWSGYITDPLQERWSALRVGIILGAVWAIWHIVPYFQADRTLTWVAWQCAATIAMRVLIVWLYNNTGRSVFAAILFHTMINVSTFVFPNYGSGYDPLIAFLVIGVAAAVVTFLWGAETLTHYRYAPLHELEKAKGG